MTLRRRRQPGGFTLAFAAFLSIAFALLLIAITRTIISSSHRNSHANSVALLKRLAETGASKAIGRLAVDPNGFTEASFTQDYPEGPGETHSSVATRTTYRGSPGYYVITSATRTVNDRTWFCRMHTYARVSNVADYFTAINGPLVISDGTDIGGKVYGESVTFAPVSPSTFTKVYSVEYATSCSPNPITVGDRILISTPASGQAVQLTGGMLFPQVLDSDIRRYKELAHIDDPDPNKRHDECDFTVNYRDPVTQEVHIFPPGYNSTRYPDDRYLRHNDADNKDHVYFCSGDMKVEGTIHGQILFVALGNIHISSGIISASASDPLPGTGVSSSTAHQAVLITRGRVVVDNTFTTDGVALTVPKVQRIEALIMAPNGQLEILGYGLPGIHDFLGIAFTGSTILDSSPNFSSVFRHSRTYRYMDSLKRNPPPYLPALAEVLFQFEEISTPNMH